MTRVGEAAATFADLDPESSYAFETDTASWRSRMTYDDGDAEGDGPNYAQGRLVKVGENTDADAAATSREAPAGEGIVTGSFTYNPREWVTGIDYPGRFTVNQRYDGAGNVTSQRYRRAASEAFRAAGYFYDRLHRLTGFSLQGGRQTRYYRYDRNGNLRHYADQRQLHPLRISGAPPPRTACRSYTAVGCSSGPPTTGTDG